MKRVLVTGSSGFIGNRLVSNFLLPNENVEIVLCVDTHQPKVVFLSSKYVAVRQDVSDTLQMVKFIEAHNIDTVFHLAAVASVDASIEAPEACALDNLKSTTAIFEAVRRVSEFRDKPIRLVNVSTDEVYGSRSVFMKPLTEEAKLNPTNPYSASKAYGIGLASAYHNTYGLDVVTTCACNTYGPMQTFDKLIPRTIKLLDSGNKIPIYGDGNSYRFWMHVDDHCRALMCVANEGKAGQVYNVSSGYSLTIKQVVTFIANLMGIEPEKAMLFGVEDRLGHDLGYNIDNEKLTKLGWLPYVNIFEGLRHTVSWYSNNKHLWSALR